MYSDGGSGGDGWSSSFSLLEENGSCQGSPWEPDNVKVETARRSVGGTCWALLGPGQLYLLPGGWTGLGMPAGSGNLAQGASGVGHGSASLALGCSGGRELQVRESVPHLCPPPVVPIPTYFLCHMLLAVTYLKRQLLHPQCFHICDYFQPHNY